MFKPSCSTPFTLFLRLVSDYRPFQLYVIPKNLHNTSVFSSLLTAYFYLTGHSPVFIYNTALLYIILLTLWEQSDVGTSLSEAEIRDILKDQGVVGVNRVTLKEGKVIPTNTLFLTFGSPELPKEITVGYLKVKVALFVLNPMHCFNCNKFGLQSQRCKVAAKCMGCWKDKHEGQCEGPKLCSNCNGPHASSAKDCPVWQKEKEIQRVCVEKRRSFPAARQLVQAKMPTVISGGKTYAAAASTRRESKSVQRQTSLTWVFSERPLRMSESNVRSTGGPGSVSTGTHASSGKSRTVSAKVRVQCESAKCCLETDGGSADPPKQPLGVPPIPKNGV